MTKSKPNPLMTSARAVYLAAFPLLALLVGCSPDETQVVSIPRSDAEALAHQDKTDFTLRGWVKINGKVPFGRGLIVAYRADFPQKAVASAKFHLDGSFSMENVPVGELILVLKPHIETSTNPALKSASGGPPIPGDMGPKNNYVLGRVDNISPGGGTESIRKHDSAHPPQPPKKEILDALKFDSLPSGELLPEVEWLLDQAFNKYGNPTKGGVIKTTIEEDNEKNVLLYDLRVP